MKLKDLFPSKWLKAEDVKKAMLATIKNVVVEEVNEGEEKPVVKFLGDTKPLVLNKTNSESIGALYGDDTDNWPGKQVVLYSAPVQFGGKMVDGIRIRGPRQQAATPAPQAQPAAPGATAVTQSSAAGEDDVPF